MELDNTHRRFLLNYLRKHGCSHEDAQDIVQETMIKVWKGFHGNIQDQRAWMVGVAHNTMITEWRKTVFMRRKQVTKKEVHVPNQEELLGTQELSEAPIQARELQRHLAGLDALSRQALEMFLEGYINQEIAQTMGIPIGTVKSYLHRAKRRILENCEA
jgi:RNA polymerase sigma-70 factor, ECF subfamily